jgi:hypothetical protein
LKEEFLHFEIPPLERSPNAQPCSSVSWEQNGYYAATFHVLLWYTWLAGAFTFTQTSYFLKLMIATTNALPRWRLNVETKTKCTLRSSRRLSFNEVTNAKILVLYIVLYIVKSTRKLFLKKGIQVVWKAGYNENLKDEVTLYKIFVLRVVTSPNFLSVLQLLGTEIFVTSLCK